MNDVASVSLCLCVCACVCVLCVCVCMFVGCITAYYHIGRGEGACVSEIFTRKGNRSLTLSLSLSLRSYVSADPWEEELYLQITEKPFFVVNDERKTIAYKVRLSLLPFLLHS